MKQFLIGCFLLASQASVGQNRAILTSLRLQYVTGLAGYAWPQTGEDYLQRAQKGWPFPDVLLSEYAIIPYDYEPDVDLNSVDYILSNFTVYGDAPRMEAGVIELIWSVFDSSQAAFSKTEITVRGSYIVGGGEGVRYIKKELSDTFPISDFALEFNEYPETFALGVSVQDWILTAIRHRARIGLIAGVGIGIPYRPLSRMLVWRSVDTIQTGPNSLNSKAWFDHRKQPMAHYFLGRFTSGLRAEFDITRRIAISTGIECGIGLQWSVNGRKDWKWDATIPIGLRYNFLNLRPKSKAAKGQGQQ